MDRLTVQMLKYELQKRQLDSRGFKTVLKGRLRDVLIEEGHDPDSYISEFEVALSGPARRVYTHLGGDGAQAEADAVGPGIDGAQAEADDVGPGGDVAQAAAVDVGPDDSASQVFKQRGSRSALSHGSRASQNSRSSDQSSTSRRLDEAVKRADLLARASMSKAKRDMEDQELQMQLQMRRKREDLELEMEIMASQARTRAIVEEEERIIGGNGMENDIQPSYPALRAEAAVFQPTQTSYATDTSLEVDPPYAGFSS